MDWWTLATEATEAVEMTAWWDHPLIAVGIPVASVFTTAWLAFRRDSRGKQTVQRAARLEELAVAQSDRAEAQEQRAIEQEKRAKAQHELALKQEARNRRQDDIADREVATQLRVEEDFPPTIDGRGGERQGIKVANHHPTLTFTDIDVVVQTDEVPAPHIQHVGILPPGESEQVFCAQDVHVRVVYKADHAGQWEIAYADIDPQWNRIS